MLITIPDQSGDPLHISTDGEVPSNVPQPQWSLWPQSRQNHVTWVQGILSCVHRGKETCLGHWKIFLWMWCSVYFLAQAFFYFNLYSLICFRYRWLSVVCVRGFHISWSKWVVWWVSLKHCPPSFAQDPTSFSILPKIMSSLCSQFEKYLERNWLFYIYFVLCNLIHSYCVSPEVYKANSSHVSWSGVSQSGCVISKSQKGLQHCFILNFSS